MSDRLFADIYDGTPSFDAGAYKRAGHVVIAIKASEGATGGVQATHHERSVAAHSVGLSVVHYHFARPDHGNTPEDEARQFLAAMGGDLHEGDWVALDYERFTGQGAEADVRWINRFWTYVHEHAPKGLPDRSWLYASRSVLNDFIATGKLIIHRLWDADWSPGPSIKTGKYWTIARQRSGDGKGPGPHSLTGIGGAVCDVDELDPSVVPHR